MYGQNAGAKDQRKINFLKILDKGQFPTIGYLITYQDLKINRFVCRFLDHFKRGLKALYTPTEPKFNGKVLLC